MAAHSSVLAWRIPGTGEPVHGFPEGSVLKNLSTMQEMQVLSLGREDPLEWEMTSHSYVKNPMDRRAWWATVHGVAKSQTRLRE